MTPHRSPRTAQGMPFGLIGLFVLAGTLGAGAETPGISVFALPALEAGGTALPGTVGTAPPAPAPTDRARARITPDNVYWHPDARRLVARFAFPAGLTRQPFMIGKLGPAQARLARLVAEGRAAGNAGDLYDNRDGGHSKIPRVAAAQLTHTVYGPEARAAGVHYGLNTQILFEAITFGNSSTAVRGALKRSLPRLAMTTPGGAERLWQLYANNHIYVFPEHRDHDPVAAGGRGDLLPAQTPYVLISQGSSGSDRPLLEAVRMILAAFRPEVKDRLRAARLIAPTVQRILRRARVADEAAYLSAAAHPPVFDGAGIDPDRLIDLAQALTPLDIPPLVHIAVTGEDAPGIAAGELSGTDGLSERLFDTPSAIARAWRHPAGTRRYVLEAGATYAPGAEDQDGPAQTGNSVRFHWRLLRGDPDRVRITPLDPAGRQAEIRIDWHMPVPGPGLAAPRIDIAVFAGTGQTLSAPAFFSVLLPGHETRVHAPGPQGPLVREIGPGAPGVYADPLVWPRRPWTDRFAHDAAGRLLGWTRTAPGAPPRRFSAHGHLVHRLDAAGRPQRAEAMVYRMVRQAKGIGLEAHPAGQFFDYVYDGPQDRIGRPAPVE